MSLHRTNPLLLFLGVILIVFLTSDFAALGTQGIIMAVVTSMAICTAIPFVMRSVRKQISQALDGRPNKLDHALAPAGYRRSRLTETPQEAYAQSVVRRHTLPNMPYKGVEDVALVDASPAGLGNRAAVKAQTRAVARYDDGDVLHLASDFHPHVDTIAGKAIFVAGIRRSGKTNFAALLAEEEGKQFIPELINDLEGDYLSLIEVLPRGIIAGHPTSYDPGAQYPFEPVTVADADVLGFNILDEGLQVILDMQSYTSNDEACQVIIGIVKGLFNWANQHTMDRVPCSIYLDEAQYLLPEHINEAALTDKTIALDLLKTFMDVIARGGKRGLAPRIMTQRIAQCNKKIMAQSEIYVLMKQTLNNDLDRYMELVNPQVATAQEIAAFSRGQAVVIAPTGEQFVTTFDQRRSASDRSTSPRAAAAKERFAAMPRPQTTVNSSAFRGVPGRGAPSQQDSMPDVPMKDTVDEEKQEPERIQLGKEVFITTQQFEKAVRLRKEGISTGYRDLMPIFDLSEHHAKELNRRIREALGQAPE